MARAGRQVRRGEHGVKVTTFVPMNKKTGESDPDTGEEKRVPLGKRSVDGNGLSYLANRCDQVTAPGRGRA